MPLDLAVPERDACAVWWGCAPCVWRPLCWAWVWLRALARRKEPRVGCRREGLWTVRPGAGRDQLFVVGKLPAQSGQSLSGHRPAFRRCRCRLRPAALSAARLLRVEEWAADVVRQRRQRRGR